MIRLLTAVALTMMLSACGNPYMRPGLAEEAARERAEAERQNAEFLARSLRATGEWSDCVVSEAKRLGRISREAADVVVRAAFNTCVLQEASALDPDRRIVSERAIREVIEMRAGGRR